MTQKRRKKTMIFDHTLYVPIVGYRVSLNEFPEHISFVIEIGGCLKNCPDCHRPDMRDTSATYTPYSVIDSKVKEAIKKGANAIIIMGGTTNKFLTNELIRLINYLAYYAPVCLYSGSDDEKYHRELVKKTNLSALKTGSYKKELGGLTSPTTNQRFYLIEKGGTDSSKVMVDITHKFYYENTHDQPKKR